MLICTAKTIFTAILLKRLASNVSSVFGKCLVRIAVKPAFARLGRCNNWMSAGTRVFAGVLIGRAIAAQCNSTLLARPQMNPVAAYLHAFFAFAPVRLSDGFNCVQMRTAPTTHDLFTVVILCFPTSFVATRGSCEFRQRPFRLRRQPLRNVSLIPSGHRQLQRFREDWFRAERVVVCFRATRARQRRPPLF